MQEVRGFIDTSRCKSFLMLFKTIILATSQDSLSTLLSTDDIKQALPNN